MGSLNGFRDCMTPPWVPCIVGLSLYRVDYWAPGSGSEPLYFLWRVLVFYFISKDLDRNRFPVQYRVNKGFQLHDTPQTVLFRVEMLQVTVLTEFDRLSCSRAIRIF